MVGDIQSLVSEAVTDVRIEHPSVPIVSHMTTVVDASNLRLHNHSDIILIIILPASNAQCSIFNKNGSRVVLVLVW